MIRIGDNLTEPEEILAQEFSEEFIELMRNRSAAGYLRYGPCSRNAEAMDMIADATARIEKYRETGNIEWLVDAANFLRIEFQHPQHAAAHFAVADPESAGHPRNGFIDQTYNHRNPQPGDGRAWFYRREGD